MPILGLKLACKSLYVHAVKILRKPALLRTHACCACPMAKKVACMTSCVQKKDGCVSEQVNTAFCGFCCLSCHCPCGLTEDEGGDEKGDFLYRHLLDLPMSGRPGLCPGWWQQPLKRITTAAKIAAKVTCDLSFRKPHFGDNPLTAIFGGLIGANGGGGTACKEEQQVCSYDKECCSYRCHTRGWKQCRYNGQCPSGLCRCPTKRQ